jgi:hypothetical protein
MVKLPQYNNDVIILQELTQSTPWTYSNSSTGDQLLSSCCKKKTDFQSVGRKSVSGMLTSQSLYTNW